MSELELIAVFQTKEQFLHALAAEIESGGLLIRNIAAPNVPAMSKCLVTFRIGDETPFSVGADVAAVVPNVGVAVLFSSTSVETLRKISQGGMVSPEEEESEPGESREDASTGSVAQQLRNMTVAEKMQVALSADRDTRFALIRDNNKALHIYVLRNPRIGIDEVQYAAKLATLSPDALKFIAEHKEWGLNSTICTALVRNPKLAMPLALKLLGRIPSQEVRAIAKGGARQPLVVAARKLING